MKYENILLPGRKYITIIDYKISETLRHLYIYRTLFLRLQIVLCRFDISLLNDLWIFIDCNIFAIWQIFCIYFKRVFRSGKFFHCVLSCLIFISFNLCNIFKVFFSCVLLVMMIIVVTVFIVVFVTVACFTWFAKILIFFFFIF